MKPGDKLYLISNLDIYAEIIDEKVKVPIKFTTKIIKFVAITKSYELKLGFILQASPCQNETFSFK